MRKQYFYYLLHMMGAMSAHRRDSGAEGAGSLGSDL